MQAAQEVGAKFEQRPAASPGLSATAPAAQEVPAPKGPATVKKKSGAPMPPMPTLAQQKVHMFSLLSWSFTTDVHILRHVCGCCVCSVCVVIITSLASLDRVLPVASLVDRRSITSGQLAAGRNNQPCIGAYRLSPNLSFWVMTTSQPCTA